ncbi:MAG TPA: AAA family ATPase, partial [Acidimicrobiia bacterium]|nr:AAA family ATPase [Acidimicrobiia bacterium]
MRAGYGTVTVLFTDLVGSTDLLSRLGEATFDGVRRSHFSALRQAIGRHRGEEVKTLGDGVLAAFGSAADAVACAASVQQSVERWSRSGRAPLAVRVGLALGEVSFEDDDVFGAPVVEAARLVAAAGAGEILATSLVAMVAGGRSDARFVEVGPMELKGLPNPVAVCRVEWESAGGTTCPLPAFLTDVGRIFVGREPELERLAQLWKEAGAGERRLVLLAGEPGVGKTRLAAELAGNVHGEGALVLAGRCDEDLGVPYQPFVEALRHFVGHAAGDELRDDLGRHAGELARLVPELTHLVADLSPPLESDPETERYRLFDAVAAWLAGTSADDPLLLVLDDLQWAAKPTFLLLRHVLRSAEPMRLLVIGTYRDTDLGPGHPLTGLLADLRRDATVARLGLGGLDQLAVSSFVEQAAGHRLDDAALALATAVHKETEGNPFFVKEVLRHLTETGGIERRGSRWVSLPVDELGIPEGVREVVGKRLSRLSGDANRLLHTAAVVGAEFEPAILGAAGDFDEEGLMSALEEGTGARLLTEADSGRYRFAHALVRDTLYQGLSAVRRETLHRRVAEAIERGWAGDRDDDAPTLAHHWARAGPSAAGTVKAVEYATQAGDRAVAQLASEEAVGWYGQALELHAQGTGHADDRQTELLIRLGEAQKAAGLPSFRETLL